MILLIFFIFGRFFIFMCDGLEKGVKGLRLRQNSKKADWTYVCSIYRGRVSIRKIFLCNLWRERVFKEDDDSNGGGGGGSIAKRTRGGVKACSRGSRGRGNYCAIVSW